MVQLLSKSYYNKWYAEMRLLDTRRGYSLMNNLFYPIDTWPTFIIEIFVTPLNKQSYHDR